MRLIPTPAPGQQAMELLEQTRSKSEIGLRLGISRHSVSRLLGAKC